MSFYPHILRLACAASVFLPNCLPLENYIAEPVCSDVIGGAVAPILHMLPVLPSSCQERVIVKAEVQVTGFSLFLKSNSSI